MAVTVTTYRNLARDAQGNVIQAGQAPAASHEELANGASAVNTANFADGVTLARVATDAKIRIAVGVSAVATSTSPLMHANSTEFFSVRPGDRISVINS